VKSIGLSLDEALLYWRRAFQPRVNDEKFSKDYAYNIRHNYGQEGKRTNYSPYSCVKIITSNHPSAGDHHGCPFRHFSPENLRSTLRAGQVPEANIQEVLELVKNQHFQVACTRYYEITHKIPTQTDLIEHPNTYVDLSMGKATKKDAKDLDQKYTFKDQANPSSSSSTSSLTPAAAAAAVAANQNKVRAATFFGAGVSAKGKENEVEKRSKEDEGPALKKPALIPTNDDFDSMLDPSGEIPDF